jgi:hypothetical protein
MAPTMPSAVTIPAGGRIIGRGGWAAVAKRRLVAQLVAAGLGIAAILAGFGIAGIFVADVVASIGLLLALGRRAEPCRPDLGGPRPGRGCRCGCSWR